MSVNPIQEKTPPFQHFTFQFFRIRRKIMNKKVIYYYIINKNFIPVFMQDKNN